MEMSVGTIVTIVLLMTVLISGLFLISKIFSSATGVVDLTDAQLRKQVQELWSEESSLVIFPETRLVEIKQGQMDGVGIGIRNLIPDSAGSNKFSYSVLVGDASDCNGNTNPEDWFTVGASEDNIPLSVGSFTSTKVLLRIPSSAPLCTVRFRVKVDADGQDYATDYFDIVVKPK
jgi:hypothetical protein